MDIKQNMAPSVAGTEHYGDLALENGELTLTDGVEAIEQAVVQRIRTLQGEVFLDLTLGVPYYQSLFGQRGGLSTFEQALQSAILTTPGVVALAYWRITPKMSERRLDIAFRVTTVAGNVSWSGTLGA